MIFGGIEPPVVDSAQLNAKDVIRGSDQEVCLGIQ